MSPNLVRTRPKKHNSDKGKLRSSYPTYTDYVQTLCTSNPSLLTLQSFLTNPKARSYGCHATALDFEQGLYVPIIRRISDIDCLSYEFEQRAIPHPNEKNPANSQHVQGRILIIEDLTVDVIQMIGCELDLDPLFLATHIHTTHRTDMRHQTPDDATLPSRVFDHDYVNISYHQPVTSDVAYPTGGRFSLDAAIDRKLVFLRATTIGLVQHRVSVVKVRRTPHFWLALILVDPPLGDGYFVGENKEDQNKVTLDLRPYLGKNENFMELPKFSEAWDQQRDNPNTGLSDDLVQYWRKSQPDCFDATDPSIQSLAYYPLRIVAAEWVKYIAVMQRCIKIYEYQGSQVDLEKFSMDLRELQGWRRRSMRSQQKIRAIICHLESHKPSNPKHSVSLDQILGDFRIINNDIGEAGSRLENMLPVVTSLIQIMDARQSFAETANISRLTMLALTFVPLSYVSSLFSMNSETMPGSAHFWVYFAVAIPFTLMVFLIARPPTMQGIQGLSTWLRSLLKRRPRRTLPEIEFQRKHISHDKEDG